MKRLAAAALLVASAACTPSPRDVVPETEDRRVVPDGGATPPPEDAYVYVVRRPHGAVGLAEARHIKDEDARAFIDKVADDLERCATALDAQHLLVDGAVRIVAVAGPRGTPALNVKLAPGAAVAQNALLCLIAPIRAGTLPAANDSGQPALALEASWHANQIKSP